MTQPLAPGGAMVTGATALPANWAELWGPEPPASFPRARLQEMARVMAELADEVPLREDLADTFGPLVGAADLRSRPVHRWYAYKEAFSPELPARVLDALELEGPLVVGDVFGGVATTALSLRQDARVAEVRSVEWSPFAHFVGSTKLAWPELHPDLVERAIEAALAYPLRDDLPTPQLAAFANREIFDAETVQALVSVREHVRGLGWLSDAERNFLLLGIASIVEDSSGAMKDGRALRILRGRTRTPSSLAWAARAQGVTEALREQWAAMLEDLRALGDERADAAARPAAHLRGDARRLDQLVLADGRAAFAEGAIDAFVFSPPYLNAIDYTEVYKLELWLLEFVRDQQQFRELRLGTLRSHPSVRFPSRGYLDGVEGPAIDFLNWLSEWVSSWSARPENGPVIRQYFADMLQAYREQARVLAPGGASVCVVANSTYSRREKGGPEAREVWRIPLLTDVLLAHLARAAGFDEVEIWHARNLRPRNVRAGAARESLVVARKAG